jgi:hypothetical protein
MPATTTRAHGKLLKTVLSGRVSEEDAQTFIRAGRNMMPTPVWLFEASACQSYAPSAIDIASKGFLECKKNGLHRIVAVVPSAMLRMAAALVRMATRMDLVVVKESSEAVRECLWPRSPS